MPPRPAAAPTLRYERRLLRAGAVSVACADEAGRGALSGPVSVGVVLITADTPPAPQGVRDSKLLSPARRSLLVPLIRAWAPGAVGMASAEEIDRSGIVAAMQLAGRRALAALPVTPGLVLLDGDHDYLSAPPGLPDGSSAGPCGPPVTTLIKADLRCAGVAAASILAKTARDAVMEELALEHPGYGWEKNKGYASPGHIAALSRLGPSPHHRTSWRLPGVA